MFLSIFNINDRNRLTKKLGVIMLSFDDLGNTDLLQKISLNELKLAEYDQYDLTEINTPDRSPLNGNTPLLFAIKRGMTKLAIYLIDKGAKVDLHDARGYFPIHYAAILRDIQLIEHIIKHSPIHKDEMKRTNQKTNFYFEEFKPDYKTRDWESVEQRYQADKFIQFHPDVTAEKLLMSDISYDNLRVSDTVRVVADSRVFTTQNPLFSNLHWHIVDIVKNLNLEKELSEQEAQQIKTTLLEKTGGRSPYFRTPEDEKLLNFEDLHQFPQIFVAKQIFVTVRKRKDCQLDLILSSTRPVELFSERKQPGLFAHQNVLNEAKETTPLIKKEDTKTPCCVIL